MTTILTAAEGANFVRTDSSDGILTMLLPMVDEYIKRATGRDWGADSTINDLAKAAAGILLVNWYDNPAQADLNAPAPPALTAALAMLEAEALKYRMVQFRGLSGAGGIGMQEARLGDTVVSLRGVYGVSGTQVSHFESAISVCGALQQTDTGNLSGNLYVVVLKSPADDLRP